MAVACASFMTVISSISSGGIMEIGDIPGPADSKPYSYPELSSIGTPSITNKGEVGVTKVLSPLPETLKLDIPRTAIVPRIPGLPVLF
ncbi:hypothetical protein D3C81_2158150 [compost metagenome]